MAEKTVLLVDDDEALLKALSIRLKSAGYNVVIAMDGFQAVMMAQRSEPDVVILDLKMPAGGGFSVMDKLKNSVKTRFIPVVVVSAMEEKDTEKKVKALGAARYFKKPFDTPELIEAIGELIP